MTITNEDLLEHVINGHDLSALMVNDFIDRILSQDITGPQIAAMLALLRSKTVSESEMSYFADIMIKKSIPIERPNYDYADIVGTGGDGHNTINVSTLASLTAASLGLAVAKHGNVSVSSRCGAADVLRKLNINIDLDAQGVRSSLDINKWCFLFAPNFHPTYQAVKEVRKELKIKTLFNILGPLVNPMAPPLMIIGVYHKDLLHPFASVLKNLKRKRALIVHGSGLDEIALHGPTDALLLDQGTIERLVINPAMLGLKEYGLSDVKGGSPEENAQICREVLSGRASDAKISFVAASTGALLWLADTDKNLLHCVQRAYDALKSGEPISMLDKLKEFTHGAS